MSSAVHKLPVLQLPDKISPNRVLLAALWLRPWLFVTNVACSILGLVPSALIPIVIGRAVEAIGHRDWSLVGQYSLVVVVLGLIQAFFNTTWHFVAHGMWIYAQIGVQREITRYVSQLGSALHKKAGPNTIAAIASDAYVLAGPTYTIGKAVGSAVMFGVVGVMLLNNSLLLGIVALVGAPLAVLGIGPFIRKLKRSQGIRREQLGKVNNLGSDIVSGLRILRGIGGEQQFLTRFIAASQQVRQAGLQAGRSEAWLATAQIIFPGLITVIITWLGARLALNGTISVGELIAFYGLSTFLVSPVTNIIRAAGIYSSARVAAEKICAILQLQSDLAEPQQPVALPPGQVNLYDSETGITIAAGTLTVLNAGKDAELLADRLARFTDAASGEHVLIGGIPINQVPLSDLRRQVVYAHNQDLWFSGILHEQLIPDTSTTVDVATVLHAASSEDIIDAFPNGIEERIGERGREVSGGQRQRLSLARALAIDADILILDDPTSAVDAHTEARITRRLAQLRQGKTTIVLTHSPLWAAVADTTYQVGTSR